MKMYDLAKEEYPDLSETELHQYVYEAQQKDLLFDPNHRDFVKKDVRNSIEKFFGIFCLTSNENNFLMWSHYSNSHTGFCVGFNTEILIDTLKCIIGPIDYTDIIPKFKFYEPIEVFTQKLLGTKGTVWSYENEYRIILHDFANKSFQLPKEAIIEINLGCKMDFKTKTGFIQFIKKNNPDGKIFDTKQSNTKFELIRERIY